MHPGVYEYGGYIVKVGDKYTYGCNDAPIRQGDWRDDGRGHPQPFVPYGPEPANAVGSWHTHVTGRAGDEGPSSGDVQSTLSGTGSDNWVGVVGGSGGQNWAVVGGNAWKIK